MRKTLLSVMIVLSVASGLWASSDTMSGIKLLPGYRAKRGQAVDAVVWTIERDGGPIIEFEAGPSEGSFPDPKERDLYSWHREQVINGFNVRLALIKPGVETISGTGESSWPETRWNPPCHLPVRRAQR